MVAVINGLGLGLYNNTSLNPAGGGHSDPTVGRFGDRVYVNGQTGNLVIQQQDEFLASIGLDTSLLRTYNSLGAWDGDNNDNWRVSAYQRLHTLTGTPNTGGSTIKKTYADGHEALFTYQTSGTYAGKYLSTDGSGAHDTLSYDGTLWTWTDGTSATKEIYQVNPLDTTTWRLYQCKDADNNTTTYGYHSTSGLLTQITDHSGQITELEYTGNNLTQIRTMYGTAEEQIRIRYTYDAQNRLQKVIVDLSPADGIVDDNGDSNLDEVLVGTVRDNIFITTYGYDSAGRVNSIDYTGSAHIGFEYDSSDRVILITDGNGQETSLFYGNPDQTDITDPLGRTTSYRFEEGKLIETLSPQLLNGERLSTQYQYDTDDNIVRIIDAKGNAVDYVYEDGRLMEERDAQGNTVRYTYTSTHQLSTRTVYRTPDPDGSGTEEPQQPLTTHYIYDGEDHLLFTVSPEGSVTEYRYNTNGSLNTRLTYTANAYTGGTFTEAALVAWAGTADLTKLHLTEYAYEPLRGQLSQQTTYSATDVAGAGAGPGSVIQYVYDRAGRLLSTVDANNHQTVYQYDGLGRVTQTTDALSHVTTTTYDDLGNSSTVEYANGLHRISTFDATGRLISITETNLAETQILGETHYVYDATGRLRAIQNPNGVITHTLYDAAGRIAAEIDGSGALTENIYDRNGRIIRTIGYATAVSSANLASLVNLDNGELVSVNEVALASIRPASTTNDRTHYNVYDAAGRLRITIDAQGYITEYRYDGTGALIEKVAHGTAFPGLGEADTSTAANDPVTVDWSNVQTINNPDGSITLIASGLENGQQVKIDIDLAANLDDSTVDITVLRQPEQLRPMENGSTTDTRTTVEDDSLITVNDYWVDVYAGASTAYVADAYGVSVSSSSASVTNTSSRTLTNLTQSGSNYYLANWTNPGGTEDHTSFTVKNAQNQTVHTGYTTTSGPVGTTSLPEGDYTVSYTYTYAYNPGYGGTTYTDEYANYSFSINDTKTTTVDIPKDGASSIEFYYRDNENSGSWTLASTTDHPTDSGYRRVTFTDMSSAKYYKILYKNSAGTVIAMGKGSIANSAPGVNPPSSIQRYVLSSSTEGSSLRGLLDMNQVGQFGADVNGTLEYVDVTISGGGLASPITSRTYPEVLRDILGASTGNTLNLNIGEALEDGIYNVEFHGAYRSGSGHNTVQILTNITTVQIGPRQVKEVNWSEASVPGISNFTQAKFFYRPANQPNAAFEELNFAASIVDEHFYFVEQQDTFKVHFIAYAGVEYEYRVEYRDSSGTLLNTLHINGADNSPVLYSHYELVEDFAGITPQYEADAVRVDTSTVAINIANTVHTPSRVTPNVTQDSNGNYFLGNYQTAYGPLQSTSRVTRNAYGVTVYTGNTASSGPVGTTSLPAGAYTVTYTYGYGTGGPITYETVQYGFSIVDTKQSAIDIPKQGASSIEFYYRDENSTGTWTQVSSGNITSSSSEFTVKILGLSGTKEFKVVYKDPGNDAFALGKGLMSVGSIGTVNSANMQLYTLSADTDGSSLDGLVDLNQLGNFGDHEAGDIEHIQAIVWGNGFEAYDIFTYPEIVRDLTGNNRINLAFEDELPDGRYNIEVYAKYYGNDTPERILLDVTSIQIGQKQYHQQTLSWPESAVENIADVTAASFFYRPAGSASNVPFTQVRLSESGGEMASHFIRENGRFSVQLFDLQQTQYEYYVKYWDGEGRLIGFTDPAGALPIFTVKGSATSDVAFSHYAETAAAAAGSRLDGYLSAAELPEIDYLSVDVIDDVTGLPYRENVITIPRLHGADAGDLNLTVDAPLPEGRYSIVVTRHYKDGADGLARPAVTMPAFIHEVGMKPVVSYAGNIEEQGDIISLRFSEHLDGLPAGLSGAQAVSMILQTISDELDATDSASRVYKDENGLLIGVLDTTGELIGGAGTGADITIDNSNLQFDWEAFLSGSAGNEALLTGLADGRQIKLALDLAQGISDSTVDITIQRPADNDHTADSSATNDARAESDNSLSVTSTYASVPDSSGITAAYHTDAANISRSTSGAGVTNTNQRTLSGITQSGSNYYLSGWVNPPGDEWSTSYVVRNAQNQTVYTGSSASNLVGTTSLPEGSYTVSYTYAYYASGGYGGSVTYSYQYATYNFSIDDTKITTIDIPKQGANNILFYHRNNENSGSWTSASVTDTGSYFRVTFSDLSATKYYKIVYRNSSNVAIGMGKGSIANSAVGVNTTSNTDYYALNGSTGSSLYGQLTMSEVGEFGADVDGTLEYVDVTVSGGGLGSPITTRTYTELARDLSGLNSGNVLNLRLSQTLPNGIYSVGITKYYRSGSGHTTSNSNTSIQVGPVYHDQQTLTWSGTTLQNLSEISTGTFYYRLAGSSGAFTQLQMVTSAGGATNYFLKNGNDFSVRLYDVALGSYEYYVMYRDADGRLVDYINPQGTLPTFNIGTTNSGTSVTFKQLDYDSASTTGTRILGYLDNLTAPQLAAIDYLSVDVIELDYLGNVIGPYRENVLTVPGIGAGSNTDLNLTADGALPEGRYRIDVTTHYKEVNGSIPAPQSTDFIHEQGFQTVAEYTAAVDLQIDDIFVNMVAPINSAHLPQGFAETDLMTAVVDLLKDQFTTEGQGHLEDSVYYDNGTTLTGRLSAHDYVSANTITTAILNWQNLVIPADDNGGFNVVLEETGTDRIVQVKVDLAADPQNTTAQVNVLRQPEQPYEFDSYSRSDSRTVVNDSITLESVHGTAPSASETSPNHFVDSIKILESTQTLGVSYENLRREFYGEVGITYTPSRAYSSNSYQYSVYRRGNSTPLYSGSGGWQAGTLNTTIPIDVPSLVEGDYTVRVKFHMAGPFDPSQPPYQDDIENYYFSIDETLERHIDIPKSSAFSGLEFQYRDLHSTGDWKKVYLSDAPSGDRIKDMGSYYRVTVDLLGNDSDKEFRIYYKNGSSATGMSKGVLTSSAPAGNAVAVASYNVQPGTPGSTLHNILNLADIGQFGADVDGTFAHIEVVVDNGDPIITYSEVVRDLIGINEGRLVNLSHGQALANGLHSIVITGYERDGENLVPVELFNDEVQIGLDMLPQQTITWSAEDLANIEGFAEARFFYRPAGSQGAFTSIEFDPSPEDAYTYFTSANGDFKVNLHNITAGEYEYYVKYWDANGRLLNTIGDLANPEIFNAGQTGSLNTASHYNVDTTEPASGTRLIGYLQNSELAAIDHVSVDVYNLETSQYLVQNVLTIPHVEASYPTDLNLTADTPLPDGRYRIEVTKYYKDDANGNPVASTQAEFIHEVGLQTVVTNSANVTIIGDVINVSFNGNLDPNSTDEVASSVSLDIDRASGTAVLNAIDMDAGIYRYRQQVTYGDVVLSETSGRFAAYAGLTPEVELVEKFYGRDKVVGVTVTDSLTETVRSAVPLASYNYADTAQGVRIQAVSSVVDGGLTIFGNNGNNPVISWSSSHRPDGAGTTVFSYKRFDANAPTTVSVNNTAGDQTVNMVNALPGTYTFTIQYRNGNEILKTGTGSFTIAANNTLKADIIFEQYIEVADPIPGVSLIPKSGISVNYPAGTQLIYAWVVDSVTGYIVSSPDGSPTITEVVVGHDGRINLQRGEGGIPEGRYDVYVQFVTASGIIGDAPPVDGYVAEALANQQHRVDTQRFSLAGDTAHAWFYDADTGELLYSQAIDPAGSSVFFNAAPYGDGDYLVRMTTFQSSGTGSIPLETLSRTFRVDAEAGYRSPHFIGFEIGGQTVYTPSTEVRWNASQRPKNTDVYFRYKAVAEAEYDPQNLWIRATAARDAQGDYYVRFPQVTPDGKKQLDPLTEGQYDYVIIYVDRQTGREVESATGRFEVVYESTPGNSISRSHEVVFGVDSEIRRARNLHDDNGQLVGELDGAGYLTEHVYDAGGRLIRTTRYATESPAQYRLQGTLAQLRPQTDSARDLTTHYFYDNQGRQTGVLDAEGYLTAFTYDAAGNLSEETRYTNKANAYTGTESLAQLIPATDANDRSTAYTYTALNQVETITTRAGAMSVSTTEYEYDAMGNRVRTTTALNTADERSTWSGYDLQNRLVHQVTGEGTAAFEAWLAANPGATQGQIDAQLAQIISTYGAFNQYNAANQLINREDQNGHISRFYYDANGRIVFEINAAGEIVERVYNSFGQVIQNIQYATRIEASELSSFMGGFLTQTVRSSLTALRDAENDSVVQQAYDTRGLVISRTDQLGYETTLQYNAFGDKRFERETLQGGANDGYLYETEYLYDSRGLRTNILNNTLGEQFNQGFDYDAFGRTQASYTYGNSTGGVLYNHYFNRYDRLGRTVETLEVLDSKLNHINRIAQYSYDAFNRKLTHRDANGQVTTFSYDDAARSMIVTTPEGVAVTTISNRHGETVSVTDGNGYISEFEYDRNGQLLSRTDGEANVVANDYDNAGRLVFTTDAEGHQVQNVYDAANRVIERTVDPSGLNLTTTYTYDAKGRLIETTDPEGVITQTWYDNKGQVISVVVDPIPGEATEEEAGIYLNLVTNYTYDGRGRRLSVEQGGSNGWVTEENEHIFLRALNTTHYEYDVHGRLVREIADPTIVTTDPDDVEHTFQGLNLVTEYGYDAAGNRNSVTDANGFTTEYVYDQFGRLRFTLSPVGDVTLAAGYVTVAENRYDAAGNLVQSIQYAQSVTKQSIASIGIEAVVAGMDSPENRISYQVYDGDNRLAYSISPQGVVTEFRYDGNNNIVSQLIYPAAVDTSEGVPALLAELLALQDADEIRQSWSVYDANGRALYNVDALGHVTANDYDGNGRLLRSIQYATPIDTSELGDYETARATVAAELTAGSGDRVTRYAYDAAGRQVYTIDPEGYLTQTGYDLYELNEDDEIVRTAVGLSMQATRSVRYADQVAGLSGIPTLQQIAAYIATEYPQGPGENDRISYTLYDTAGRVGMTRDAEGYAERFAYDSVGNKTAYMNRNGEVWFYRYDALNRLVEERSPEVEVTRIDATTWQQTFDTNLTGLSGSISSNSSAYTVADGRLTLRTTGTETWLNLLGNDTNIHKFGEFEHHPRFEYDITLGANPSQIQSSVGASNAASGEGLRYHRLLVEGANEGGNEVIRLYAEYRYENEYNVIVQDRVLLGEAVANRSYMVEVVADAETTTLYVYERGQTRDQGYSDTRLATGWTNAYSEIRNHTGIIPGLHSLHINQMREMLPRERALFDEGTILSERSHFEAVVTRYEYNAMGDVTARIEAAGTEDERRTEYTYDALNRQVKVTTPQVGVYDYAVDSAANFAGSRVEEYTQLESRVYFDNFGKEVFFIDVGGNPHYKVYDASGREVYDINPVNNVASNATSAEFHVTEKVYDAFGNATVLIRYADPVEIDLTLDQFSPGLSLTEVAELLTSNSGRTLTTEYDRLNRAITVTQPEVTVGQLQSGHTLQTSTASPVTAYVYNAFGQVTRQSLQTSGGWLHTYNYYDEQGNQIGSLDPAGYLTVQEYDLAGNVTRRMEYATAINVGSLSDPTSFAVVSAAVTASTSQTNPQGLDRETLYVYDSLNRRIRETQLNVQIGSATTVDEGTADYDATLSRALGTLATVYAYDGVGNVVSTTTEINGDAQGTVYSDYDALGRVISVTEISRTQTLTGLMANAVISVENPGTGLATLRWPQSPVAGMETELRVRRFGTNSWETFIPQSNPQSLYVSVGGLFSDHYEYEISYTRRGETEVYATATGTLNIRTGLHDTLYGFAYQYSTTVSGAELMLQGNVEGLTSLTVTDTDGNDFVLTLGAYNSAARSRTANLGSLDRGNYTFTATVSNGSPITIDGAFQHIKGDLGGEFAIQTTESKVEIDIKSSRRYNINPGTFRDHSRWEGTNEVEIKVPSYEHLGDGVLTYKMVLEYADQIGKTETYTVTGVVEDDGTFTYTDTRGGKSPRDHASLVRVVSLTVWKDVTQGASTPALVSGSDDGVNSTSSQVSGGGLFGRLLSRVAQPANDIMDLYFSKKRDRIMTVDTSGLSWTQQLEFINLPPNAQNAVFEYRVSGSEGDWTRKELNRAVNGYFYLGTGDITPNRYEYRIFINGSRTATESGDGLVIGYGISANESVSIAHVETEDASAVLTPLTRFKHDAFGNVVKETAYANSAEVDAEGRVYVQEDSSRDSIKYSYFDANARVVQTMDGEGKSRFFSYDAFGNLAKEWQWLDATPTSGAPRINATIYRYDGAGRQIERIDLIETVSLTTNQWGITSGIELARNQFEYNAFGEMVRRGLNDGWEEFFEYDDAGRLWRSNSDDGVVKVNVYNLQGNMIQQLRHASSNLETPTDLAGVLALSDLVKTSFVYNGLDQVTEQRLPTWTQSSTTLSPVVRQTFDRWGNVIRLVDPAGMHITRRYDRRNNMIEMVQAAADENSQGGGVSITGVNGQASTANPTFNYYYDGKGNLVGEVDAAGNERVKQYNEAGQLVRTIAGDGGVQRYAYDMSGNMIEHIRYRGHESSDDFVMTSSRYDRNNRLISEFFSGDGEAHYKYDAQGNRIEERRLVSVGDEAGERRFQVSTFEYDNRGNVIHVTLNARIEDYNASGVYQDGYNNTDALQYHYSYDLKGNRTADQRRTGTTSAVTATWSYDYFNRLQSQKDLNLGNRVTDYFYNEMGLVTSQTLTYGAAVTTTANSYYADGKLQTVTLSGDNVQAQSESYTYDIAGRTLTSDGRADMVYTYDALGRLTSVAATANTGALGDPVLYYQELEYSYDALGNRRSVEETHAVQNSVFVGFDQFGQPVYENQTSYVGNEYWYTYDGESRIVITQGDLQSGAIVRGSDGTKLTYDFLGNRLSATRKQGGSTITEFYEYDTANNLIRTTQSGTQLITDGQPTSIRVYDWLGRVTQQVNYHSQGTVSELRKTTFNDNGQQLQVKTWADFEEAQDGGWNELGSATSTVNYLEYTVDGNLKEYELVVSGEGGYTNVYQYFYNYFNEAKTSLIQAAPGDGDSPYQGAGSVHNYDAFGNLESVTYSGNSPSEDSSFVLDIKGQILRKSEGSGYQLYYYANGKPVGTRGTLESADFDFNYTPVSDQYPGLTPGSYVVQNGDTLGSIALSMFGDASLWYLIADANGLNGGETSALSAGTPLRIPNAISNLRNSTEAYKPYNPGEIIGDTTPQMPLAPQPEPSYYSHGGSGGLVAIIAIVVTIVLTVITAGAAAAALGPYLSAMLGAAVGNVAGQAIRIVGGIQNGFDFKSLATDVITAGITSKIGGTAAFKSAGTVTKAAINNVVGQGINIAMGNQDGFDWKSLATSMVSAPINAAIDKQTGAFGKSTSSNFGVDLAAGLMKGAVSNGVQIMINSGGKMDWANIAANAFGQAVGNKIVTKMNDASVPEYVTDSKREDWFNSQRDAINDKTLLKNGETAEDFANRMTQSGPRYMMASLNSLNGVVTPENYSAVLTDGTLPLGDVTTGTQGTGTPPPGDATTGTQGTEPPPSGDATTGTQGTGTPPPGDATTGTQGTGTPLPGDATTGTQAPGTSAANTAVAPKGTGLGILRALVDFGNETMDAIGDFLFGVSHKEALDNAFNLKKDDCTDTTIAAAQNYGVSGADTLNPKDVNTEGLMVFAQARGQDVTSLGEQRIQELVKDQGAFIIAAASGEDLNRSVGHSATVTENEMEWSPSLGKKVPTLMTRSLNNPDKASRSKIASQVFPVDYYQNVKYYYLPRPQDPKTIK